jgi:hypothetical protein
MAAGMTQGTGIGARTPAVRSNQRLATETKHAFKTTEFLSFVAVVAGILVSAALIKRGDGGHHVDAFIARDAWLYVSIVTAGYLVSRGLAKSGSREPYWDGGSDQRGEHDGDR